jgi:hypothetical protein
VAQIWCKFSYCVVLTIPDCLIASVEETQGGHQQSSPGSDSHDLHPNPPAVTMSSQVSPGCPSCMFWCLSLLGFRNPAVGSPSRDKLVDSSSVAKM